jgi:predicted transcriptional regulator
LIIARDQELRIRDFALAAGVSERRAQSIIVVLEQAGYISKKREGRRNVYSVNRKRPFRHQAESGHKVGELIDLFANPID